MYFFGSLARLADVGPGQLFQRCFILVIGKSGVKNVNDVQLRGSGCHGTGAEYGFIGSGVEDLVSQLRYRGIDASGDGYAQFLSPSGNRTG